MKFSRMKQSKKPDMVIYTKILNDVYKCTLCAQQLELGPKPILQMNPNAKILLIGQAPGKQAHEHGQPFLDPSGDRLRKWLGVDTSLFYNANTLAIMPMAFCFPGKQKNGSGDKPPPKICSKTWHSLLRKQLPNIELTILIGRYAAEYYLQDFSNLTSTIQTQDIKHGEFILMPHPSPRNNIWLKKNSWFETKTLPLIRQRLKEILSRI